MERHIQLPLTEELAKTLHAGDSVYLTGTIYTSRDAGHKRMCEALARGEKLPFDPTDATIYYVGPTPAKPGQVIGSAGPTTSGRMDAYAPTMMSVGARGMIGKGARLPEVVEAMKKYPAFYLGLKLQAHRRSAGGGNPGSGDFHQPDYAAGSEASRPLRLASNYGLAESDPVRG